MPLYCGPGGGSLLYGYEQLTFYTGRSALIY
jgi:hypothetical protein